MRRLIPIRASSSTFYCFTPRAFSEINLKPGKKDNLDALYSEEMNHLDDSSVTCMMLHPVAYPK